MVLRQTDDAVDAFKKQAELNPYDEYAYGALGWAYTTERKYDDAATAFNKAIEINPLSDYAHGALAPCIRNRTNTIRRRQNWRRRLRSNRMIPDCRST
jgi:tetratricopeptide (TPR) repeat protein